MSRTPEKFRLNENPVSTSFTNKLNKLVDATNRLLNIRLNVKGGTGGIKPYPTGFAFNVNIPQRSSSAGGGSTMRWAKLSEDATATNNLKGDLLNTVTGKPAISATLDADSTDDKGDGVGIPSTDHGFSAFSVIVIDGTDDYDGTHIIKSVTDDEFVIDYPTGEYVAETFDTDMTAKEEGADVDIYAEIINSSRLDMAVPRFIEDAIIPVVKRNYDNSGTPVARWYYAGILMGSDDYSEMD